MSWVQSAQGLRLDPIANGSPEALVVLLHDVGDSAATLTPIAARWATAVPTTAFIALEGIEQLDPPSCSLPRPTMYAREGVTGSTVLDRAPRHLVAQLEQQLRSVNRLVEPVSVPVEHAGELVGVGQRIGSVLKADSKVSAAYRYDEHQEVSIGHDEPTQPAAIEVAALGCTFQQRRVHEQLFVFVRLRRGGVFQSWPLM